MRGKPKQILFVHPNFPAQFGPCLKKITNVPNIHCIFLNRKAEGLHDNVYCLPYLPQGGATKASHYCSRTFENAVWQAHAVYETCKAAPELQPDLIIGHSGFGSTAMLAELYSAPIVDYFEYFYHPHDSDMDFRPDFPPQELDYLRSRMRNAMILIDLNTCQAGYTPTRWQRQLFPVEYWHKIRCIHDGVDTDFWQRRPVERRIGDEVIPDDVRIVTFTARGLEAMRGFDVFIRVAKRILERIQKVLFVCVGAERTYYGNDETHTQGQSFFRHVLASEQPDRQYFRFLGTVPSESLAQLFSLSDLHVYLTVPFVASWSLLNAMACECTILASDVAPVREFIRHGENGLLCGFFDEEGLAEQALDVLNNSAAYRHLRNNARRLIMDEYSLDLVFPQQWKLFSEMMGV